MPLDECALQFRLDLPREVYQTVVPHHQLLISFLPDNHPEFGMYETNGVALKIAQGSTRSERAAERCCCCGTECGVTKLGEGDASLLLLLLLLRLSLKVVVEKGTYA
jgi:hypothetical protein